MNSLLERVEGEVKADFSIGVVGVVDVLAGRVDDVAAMWNVRAARHAAWTNAEVLWTLRRTPLSGTPSSRPSTSRQAWREEDF